MQKEDKVTSAVREGRGNEGQKEEKAKVRSFEATPPTALQGRKALQKVGVSIVNMRIYERR